MKKSQKRAFQEVFMIAKPSAGLTFMLTDNASTIPKMITREININQVIVFLYRVFHGFMATHFDPDLSDGPSAMGPEK